MELAEFGPALDAWLAEHAEHLAPDHAGGESLDQSMAQLAKVKRAAFDETGLPTFGTTNVDFNPAMRAVLAKIDDRMAVRLSVGPNEFAAAGDPSIGGPRRFLPANPHSAKCVPRGPLRLLGVEKPVWTHVWRGLW